MIGWRNCMIKLVALDMDGTLLNSRNEIPEDFFPWVKSHPHIRTVIASGRQYQTLCDNMSEIKHELTIIAENGGFVFCKGEMIYSDPMTPDHVKQILDWTARKPGLVPIVCGAKSAYISRNAKKHIVEEASIYFHELQTCEHLSREATEDVIVKVAVYVESLKAEENMPYMEQLEGNLSVVLSGDRWIDVANATVCKGNAIKAIQEKYNISFEESMCFGDYLNDVTLIKSCGESYCMANGHPQLKELAKYITTSNDERGVMRVLEKL